MASPIDLVLEKVEPWRNAVLLIGTVGTLLVAFQVPEARPAIAHGLTYGFGPILAFLAWTRVRDVGLELSAAWLVVAVAICAASAFASQHGMEPGEPTASVHLGLEESADLVVPDAGSAFRLRVRTELPPRGSTRAKYTLRVERGDDVARLRGELYREVSQESARGGAPQQKLALHTTEAHDLSLEGRGPATLTLADGENLEAGLTIDLQPAFGRSMPWMIGVALLFVFALGLEVWSARVGMWAPLTAVAGLALVLGHYTALRYDVDEPLITFIGGSVTAFVIGGVGGLVLGLASVWLSGRVASRREADDTSKEE